MATTGVTFATLRTRLQAIADLSDPEANARLNQRHKEMVAKARALRETLTVGSTAVGTASYDIAAEVVELMALKVDGHTYDKVSPDEMWDLQAGDAWIQRGPLGVFTDEYSGTGTGRVTLYPTPSTAGLAIVGRGAVLPPDLVADGDLPSLPSDFHEDLIDAAWATTLRRDETRFDLWQTLEQQFENRIAELRRRLEDRIGSGPVQIQIVR